MRKNKKVSKEDIMHVAFEIVKKEGMKVLNVRKVAEQLNTSVQPIYYEYGSLEELKKALEKKVLETYQAYMNVDAEKGRPYKATGMNYIKFAKEEPILFKMLFMSKTSYTPEHVMRQDQAFNDICKYAKKATGLTKDVVRKYHLRMWMYTHGIACLVATQTCQFTEQEISTLLSDEYEALNLLEEERKKG